MYKYQYGIPLPEDHAMKQLVKKNLRAVRTWEDLNNQPNVIVQGPQMDWTPVNRFEKYTDIIQVKPDSEPNGQVSRLCSEGWETFSVLKNVVQLGKLK